MTFRNLIPTIHIHPILIIFIVISFITGTFVELFIILIIVLFHELGHYAMALFFKWRVQSIDLWVFGGVMKTDEHGNKSLYEEALVTVAGPFQHLIIYGVIVFLSAGGFLPTSILELLVYYNSIILLFNLLPIWPLDGGKLLFLFLSALLPYRKAYSLIIIFSMVLSMFLLIIQLFIFSFTLSAFFIMVFLLMENRTEWKQRYYTFIRFLLKRYEGNTYIKKIHPISVPSQYSLMQVFSNFRREKKHSIYIYYRNGERRLIDENECLRSYFYNKQYGKSIGEIVKEI